jgi:hypothetical protein
LQEASVTAGNDGGTAGELGRLRTSRADRERAIDVLKTAFSQGRLTKDEFDLRVGQVFASRTYADLATVMADLPDEVTVAGGPAEGGAEPGRALSFKTAVGIGAVGAVVSMGSAASVLVQSTTVPAAAGLLLVGLTGVLVTVLLAGLLILLSWAVRRSDRQARPGPPPSGPTRIRSSRQARTRPLPPPKRHPGITFAG